MDIQIDISEHVRCGDKDSVLGFCTKDKSYKNNVCLFPRVKRQIKHFSSKWDKIHSIMAYFLLEDELHKITSIQFDRDVSPTKLINNLKKLFAGNVHWSRLDGSGMLSVSPVGRAPVDKYVKRVRNDKEPKGIEITKDILEKYLLILEQ